MTFCCGNTFGRQVIPSANRAGVAGGDLRRRGRYNCTNKRRGCNKASYGPGSCCGQLQPGGSRGCRYCFDSVYKKKR